MNEQAERQIVLQGAHNFRDLGGYPTTDGRHVRWGLVYRSDAYDELTDDDHEIVAALGIRYVCDLRRPGEGSAEPPRFLGAGEYRRFGLGGDASQGYAMLDRVMAGEVRDLSVGYMIRIYEHLLDAYGPRYGEILRMLADGATPMLFNCAAGKDRTGVAAALLLGALGVPDEIVVADYALTERYRERVTAQVRARLAEVGGDYDTVRVFFGAVPEVLAGALDRVRTRYGSLEHYLDEVAGVDAVRLRALRDHLLEDEAAAGSGP